MSFDVLESFEADNGFTVSEGAGFYSAPLIPSYSAPLGSIHVDPTNAKTYKKIGPLDTDWVELFQNINPRPNEIYENCLEILNDDCRTVFLDGCLGIVIDRKQVTHTFYNQIEIELNELLGVKEYTCLEVLNEFG